MTAGRAEHTRAERVYLVAFTRAEIAALIGVTGDVDIIAHMESQSKAYGNAWDRAEEKLMKASPVLGNLIQRALSKAIVAISSDAEVERSERRSGVANRAEMAIDKARAALSRVREAPNG